MSTDPNDYPPGYPPDPPPEWADENTTCWVTCHTRGCMSQDWPIEMNPYWTDGENLYRTGAFICGPCGNQIFDVTFEAPEGDDNSPLDQPD